MPQTVYIDENNNVRIREAGPVGPAGYPEPSGVLHADVTFHPRDTNGLYPIMEIDPIGDTETFVEEGGPAYFHLPPTGVIGINNMLNQTTSGVYDWDGSTFTRSKEADTTAKIAGKILLSQIWHHHMSGAPFPNGPQPLVAMLVPDDPDLPLGTAVWTGRPMVDFDSMVLWTGFPGWSQPLLPAPSSTSAWVDTTSFGGPDGPPLAASRDLLNVVEWRGWTVYAASGPPDPEADPPPLTSGFYIITDAVPSQYRPTAPTVLAATTSNFFTGNIPGMSFAMIYPDGTLAVKPAAEGDHLVHISGSYRGV